MKAELSGPRMLRLEDLAGIVTHNASAATAPPFPAFGMAAARFLAYYHECIATGAWARLVFETRGGDERIDVSCNPLRMGIQGSKCPAKLGGENSKNGWQKGKQQQQQSQQQQ